MKKKNKFIKWTNKQHAAIRIPIGICAMLVALLAWTWALLVLVYRFGSLFFVWSYFFLLSRSPKFVQRWHLRGMQKNLCQSVKYDHPNVDLPFIVFVKFALSECFEKDGLTKVHEEMRDWPKKMRNR